MAYNYQRPRITVEQSPWQTFFEELPGMFFSFQKLKQQAIEAEKTREFQRANMYINHLLGSKRMYEKEIIDRKKEAVDVGLNLDAAFAKNRNQSPLTSTGGSQPLNEAFQVDILKNNVDNLETDLGEINNNIQLANQGAKAASIIDGNFDGNLDTLEIENYQKANPELLESLGMTEFPYAFLAGARKRLDDPKVRAHRQVIGDIRKEIFDKYDTIPFDEVDELGNKVQLYKTFDIDPNQRGKVELEQALFLLDISQRNPEAINPGIIASKVAQIKTAGPQTYSFGDKTYTQVSTDQITNEDDGTMTTMMGGNKVTVVGDIAAYPGMKFATGERYKGKTGKTGVDPASSTWTEVQEEFDNSVETIYGVHLSSLEDRESYVSNEIGKDLMNPGKIKIAKGKMTKEGANKVKEVLGANILTLVRWGEKGWKGIPFWNSQLEKLLKAGDYEGVVDYYMDPETQTARLKELDLSDSDIAFYESASTQRKAENAMVLLKQHLKDYDMLDRPREWIDDHPREVDIWEGKETRKEGRITGGAVPGRGEFTSYKGPDFESEQGIAALKGAQELIGGLPSDTEKGKARKKMRDLKIMLRDEYGYLQEYLDYLFSQ